MAKTKRRGAATPNGPGGLKVHKAVEVKLAGLNFAAYNPRVMTAVKMRALKASLVKHGLVLNLVVQARAEDGTPHVVIGGHQRVTATRELCAERGWVVPEVVEAVVLDVDDATAKQLNVALNRIEGDFDPFRLGELFESINAALNLDNVLAMGFVPEEVLELRSLTLGTADQADALEQGAAGLDSFARSITLTVEFATLEQRDQAKEALTAEAKRLGVKPGEVLLDALKAPAGRSRKARAA